MHNEAMTIDINFILSASDLLKNTTEMWNDQELIDKI